MANKISGRIIVLTPTQTMTSKSGNSYQKRDVVIERIVFDRNTGNPTTDSNDTPIFSLIGESCSMLDKAKIGDEIVVDYELQGRSYEKDGKLRYFNDIRVFNINVKGQTFSDPFKNENNSDPFAPDSTTANGPASTGNFVPSTGIEQKNDKDDDLPF